MTVPQAAHAAQTFIMSSNSLPSSPPASSTESATSRNSTPLTLDSDRHALLSTSSKTKPVPLEFYISLGCLCVEDAGIVEDLEDNRAWVEVEDRSVSKLHRHKNVLDHLIPLIHALWIRAFWMRSSKDPRWKVLRIYYLPDDVARASVYKNSKRLNNFLIELLPTIEISPEAWHGSYLPGNDDLFDPWATPERLSLYYLFNTLDSPDPKPGIVKSRYSRDSMRMLLDPEDSPHGLKTLIYPYQRRSAAMMIQKEVAPLMLLDPRLEERTSPTGHIYYFGARDLHFRRYPRHYDTICGGILAETMGLGKTLICIAVILATKGQCPVIPPNSTVQQPVRPTVGSLTDMCCATISRNQIPWRTHFDNVLDRTGQNLSECINAFGNQSILPGYDDWGFQVRSTRKCAYHRKSEKYLLSSATIIVVPSNLIQQWQGELAKHVDEGAFKVLVLDRARQPLPEPEVLISYDVLLFNVRRFEKEFKASDQLGDSPLARVHWLRIIIDEGQGFTSATSSAALVAEKLVRADRRWIVTGTPAKDLLGVEVDLPAMELSASREASSQYRVESLIQRKAYDAAQEQASGACKALGSLASRFLKARPWFSGTNEQYEQAANWDEYVFRHEDYRARTYTSFSSCLRSTLKSLVVKTRPEDVEKDLTLPPLRHSIVRLDPSDFDKMTANLFVLLYTANAITSERTDQDYLFHRRSQAHLQRLTTNLRQSAFFWVGFDADMVYHSLEVANKYLNKEGIVCTEEDRQLLISTMNAAETVKKSPVWNALACSKEMGAFLENWPGGPDNANAWSFDHCKEPPVMGVAQILDAQECIHSQLAAQNPLHEFAAAGRTSQRSIKTEEEQDPSCPATPRSPSKVKGSSPKKARAMVINGVPVSTSDDIMQSRRISATGTTKTSPRKSISTVDLNTGTTMTAPSATSEAQMKASRRKAIRFNKSIELSPDSELGSARLVGTTSSKFSYLLDRVLELYRDEKILIFFEGDHIAWYLSQALDVFNVKHLIYANTPSSDERAKYIVLFDTDENQRVLLMDLHRAARGLNLSSASRVFFVNPPCRPDVEAQAIKRSHRIGQIRPVHVETLILKGTVEEAIHARAQKMSKPEHLAAKSLEDDESIQAILQAAKVLPLEEHRSCYDQMARLQRPQQIFGRPGRASAQQTGLEKEIFGDDDAEGSFSVKKKKSKGKS